MRQLEHLEAPYPAVFVFDGHAWFYGLLTAYEYRAKEGMAVLVKGRIRHTARKSPWEMASGDCLPEPGVDFSPEVPYMVVHGVELLIRMNAGAVKEFEKAL